MNPTTQSDTNGSADAAQHTPLPWFVDGLAFESVTDGNVGIVNLARASKADVAFIVCACNAHVALVALAKQYASECSACNGSGRIYSYGIRYAQPCHDCADIREVLSKVTP